MSTESAMEAEELEPADSASVTKVESIGNQENDDDDMYLTKEILIHLKLLYNFRINNYGSIPFEMRDLVPTKHNLDQLFYGLTNLKNPNLDDIIFLALCFTRIAHISRGLDKSLQQAIINELHIKRSITLLKGKELDRKTILITMANFLELSTIYKALRMPKKYQQYANKILEAYFIYTKGEDEFPAPINILVSVGIFDEINTFYMV
ncbi:PREDICTED: uncharacterized protein LOC106745569 [Dinoponera quadriceps]|uniref:Uncharacterized protein LOC106745569 n=1 Tax=Dinoponera quadriceps TaxID=609295 RepID=A0A6P3XE58_DINQU|nr:PREDICTED: uncharacterized protein LOC106745569 [Dinoponera quadriceps]